MSSTLQQTPVWTVIRRAAVPDVRGVSAESHDRLHVRLKLNVRPPADWVNVFDGLPSTEHTMTVRQDEIYLNPPDSELAVYVHEADARIDAANRGYETSVLPAMRASQERLSVEMEDSARRIGEARLLASSFLPVDAAAQGVPVHALVAQVQPSAAGAHAPAASTTAGG